MKKLTITLQLLVLMFSLWVPTPSQRFEGTGSGVPFITGASAHAPSLQRRRRRGRRYRGRSYINIEGRRL